MKFEEKKLENGQGQWLVTVDGDQWKEALKKAKQFLKQNVEVKGFRKGKAPEAEVNKQITPVKVYNQAFQSVIGTTFEFALEQKATIEPFNPPTPSPVKVDDESLLIAFTFEMKPDIELGQYKALKLENLTKEELEISDEEINNVLSQYQNRLAMETIKDADAKIAAGDVVTFDFDGYVDGKQFPGGEAKNYKLEIGSGQFIPGFEDAMIGLARGADQAIKVTFPAEYSPELSGKDAEFKLNITEIAQKELPELDDELAKDLAMKDVNTLEELKAKIKEDLLTQKTRNFKMGYVDRILMEIVNNSKITLPKTVVDQQVKHLKEDFEKNIEKEGMSVKEYKKALGLTDEALNDQFYDEAKTELSSYLVTSEIVKAENIEASDAEVEAKLTELSEMYSIPLDQLKTLVQPIQVKEEIVNDKLMNFLYENN